MKQAMLWLLCCSCYLSGWGQYSLSGSVTNDSGEPLSGATVLIEQTFRGTITDPNGRFEIKQLPPGEVQVKISFLGYESSQIIVFPETAGEIRVVMKEAPILADEVVVKATRMTGNTGATQSKIYKEELRKANAGQDIPFLLGITPSLVATSDAGTGVGYTNLRIRGTDSYRINVTLNGIPLNDAESHGLWWVNMPDLASSIENISIQRGVGASTLGAGAFGASIHMQSTAIQQDPYVRTDIFGGSFNTFRRSVSLGTGLLKNRFTFDARLSKLDSDGYIDRAFSHLKSMFLSAAWYGKESIVRFHILSGDEYTYQAWYGVEKSILDTNRTYNPYFYDNETDNYLQTHYQLIASHKISTGWFLNTALHYTPGKGFYEQYKEAEDLTNFGITPLIISADTITHSDLITRKWMDNDFFGITGSLNYRGNWIETILGGGWNDYLGHHFGQVIWAQFAGDSKIRHEWYRNEGDKRDLNLYCKTNLTLLPVFSLFADLQYRRIHYTIKGVDDYLDAGGNPMNIDQQHIYNFWNPKMGLSYKPDSRWNYYLSFSTGRREPTRSNYLDATPSDQKPRPETLFDYESGFEYSGNLFRLSTNLYYMDYKDQLVHTGKLNDVAYPVMVNVPSSYRAGIETEALWNPADRLKLAANINLSRNKIRNYTEYSDHYDPDWNYLGNLPRYLGETDISYSPSVVAGAVVDYQPAKMLQMTLISRYVGAQYFDNSSSADRRLDPYFITDLRIGSKFSLQSKAELELSLQVKNLFNKLYESNAYGGNWYENGVEKSWAYFFPQAGIHFLAGMSLSF